MGEVILVTGGSGFLGQHIIKLLHEKSTNVAEIRILDRVPYVKKLEFEECKKVESFTGDILNYTDVKRAIAGATTVIHAAGLVSFGTKPDFQGMKECNVEGTRQIIDACITHCVSRLVYTSTVDAAIGSQDIVGGTECNIPKRPSSFLFAGYPETKYEAECMVLTANGTPLSNGKLLQSLALRACVMYGELDPFYVVSGLKSAAERDGVLHRVGSGEAKMNQAYVGNVAWAHLCAVDKLSSKPDDVAGKFYYITDDHHPSNSFNFMKPFLAANNYRLSSHSIPYWLVYSLLLLRDIFVSPFTSSNLQPARCSISYVCTNYCFLSTRARIQLDYCPPYTPKQSVDRSIIYYAELDLAKDKS